MEPFRLALFERSVVPAAPGIGEVVGAQLGYSYAPFLDSIYNDLRYGQRDPNYDPKADAGDYIIYPEQVLRAKNKDHMAAIKRSIDGMMADRQVMSQASIGQHLVAGIVDPINLMALPFGGPTVGIGRSALRVGAGVGAIQAGLEAVALPYDPFRTYQESALNIATASLFGAGFGAALGAPLTARARAWTNTRNQLLAQFDQIRRIDEVANLSRDDIAGMQPRDQRPLGALSDEEIRVTVARIEADAENLQRSADPAAGGMDIKDRADEILAEATPYRRELGFRALELEKIDIKDPYNIAPSWFTDSMLFKAVTTPLKRQLQGKIPSVVKEKFVKTVADAGTALNLNLLGLATPQSVAQRAAVAQGRWVASHDELLKLWSADTNAPLATVLDLNIGDLARQASRAPDTYGQWLKQVNEKRIQNDTNLTENQIKAVEVINRYFKDAERRLEDVGLLGTNKGMQNQIARLEQEIAALTNELAALQTVTTGRGIREREMVKGRLGMLQKRLEERQEETSAMQEFAVNPEREDVFFPRFWDNAAINANRQEFAQVLFNWYQQNPTIMRFDPEQGRFVRVELETSERAIRERVDQTIANILGEKDPTNVDNIGFGYGRSKHFRHRQVDIPNKLVMKFIITDPLAAMKAYATRIEPRYEYARMFGKDVDGVIFDMRREMLRAGKTEAEIAKTVRDYNHLYDRIAGAVIRDPGALNQRAAFALKEAASFTYMGSAGFAALPDFGRIVMEYELQNIVKGVQTILDKQNLKRTANEVRLSGEALDILRGTAHLRLVEGMANDINANELLTKARNAFYIFNGLAPMTTIAKYLAGTVDGHTIIDYSIKLTRGELDDQSRTWLARYGIDEDTARKIARAPWHMTDKGFYMANTEQWADSIFVPEIEGKTVRIIESNEDGSPVGYTNKDGRYVPARYNRETNTIFFDREYIEGTQFNEKAWLDPKIEGVDALPDIFKTPKQWSNFVMLHEIMHSRYSAEALGFVKQVEVIKRVPSKNTVSFIRRKLDVSGRYFVHFTRKSNVESLLRNGYDVKRQSIFPTGNAKSGKLAGDVMYFTLDMNRWKRGDVSVEAGTGTKDNVWYDYSKQQWVTVKKGMIEEDLEPVGAFLSDDASVITIDSLEKYKGLVSEALDDAISKFQEKELLKASAIDNPILRVMEENKVKEKVDRMRTYGLSKNELFEHLKSKYDAIEIIQRNDGSWNYTKKDGSIEDTYNEIMGNSGNHDFFVVNKDKVVFQKEVVDQTVDGFKEVAQLESRVDTAGYENAINRLALEEQKIQQTVNQDTVEAFRVALNSGVINTIMAGTPADKPIITDGVVYIPSRIGKQFGFKEDLRNPGYVRIENGFLGLPFQFYSFALANVNKTVGALAQGQVKNRAIGVATMLGLAYMSMQIRTPDYVWDKMSWQDKFARTYDMSGVTALYSDLFYTAMHTSLALGGPNITGGLLSPKFPQQPSMADAINGFAGAGPSWATDMALGIYQFAGGDYGGGAKEVVRNLPFARMWFWKDEMNQLTKAWAQ
jgi:hypothetical protein